MDWLEIATSLGLGGALGAIVGVLAATQTAKQKFDQLGESVSKSGPELKAKIQLPFEEFKAAFERLRVSLEQLRRAMKRST